MKPISKMTIWSLKSTIPNGRLRSFNFLYIKLFYFSYPTLLANIIILYLNAEKGGMQCIFSKIETAPKYLFYVGVATLGICLLKDVIRCSISGLKCRINPYTIQKLNNI